MTAAAARAAHLIVDSEPLIFADPLAYPLLGAAAEDLVGYHRQHGAHPVLAGARAAVTTRSRYTEDRLAAAVRRGVVQYVILGAGLDSYAYRSPHGIRVFEVDHPDTQRWKRGLLAAAGIAVPDTVVFTPVDLETDALADRLAHHGFDDARPALVSWLGVTMYLTRDAIAETLAVVGGLAPGSEIVVDHMLPEHLRDTAGQSYVDLVAPVAAEHGEPWLTFLDPGEMAAMMRKCGLEPVEHVPQRDAVPAELWNRSDPLRASDLAVLSVGRKESNVTLTP
jgi:methyltransferase (TIGR00027 family)